VGTLRRLLLLGLLLAGCATGPTLAERLQGFVGQSELQLVTALGVPNRTYDVEGRRFLQYEQRRVIYYQDPGFYRPYGGPWSQRWGWWPPPAIPATIQCDITFDLQDSRVRGFSFRGEGC